MRRQVPPPGVATVSRFALTSGLVALASFIALSAFFRERGVLYWEQGVVEAAVEIPDWMALIPRALMHISTRFTIPVLALIAYFVTMRWRAAAAVTAACIAGAFPVWLAKHMVSRPRPDGVPVRDNVYGSGYASGHVTIAFAAAAAIAPYLLAMPYLRRDRRLAAAKHLSEADHARLGPGRPRWVICSIPFLMAGGVAVARLHVGVHYPADVIGGAVGGMAGAWLILSLPYFRPGTGPPAGYLPQRARQLVHRLGLRL